MITIKTYEKDGKLFCMRWKDGVGGSGFVVPTKKGGTKMIREMFRAREFEKSRAYNEMKTNTENLYKKGILVVDI